MDSPPQAGHDPMVGEVRFRLPLPVVIPLGAVVLIVLLAFGFARILLSIPHQAAVIIALATALNILGACAVIALRPRLSGARLVELAAVALYPVIIGIAIAAFDVGSGAHAGPEAPPAADAGRLTVVAEGIQFQTDTIQLAADKDVSLTFVNRDSEQHNIHIFETEAAETSLFNGEIIGPGEIEYDIPPLQPGEYYFRCDVHPSSMEGRVLAEGIASPEQEGNTEVEEPAETTES